ncbi:zona pellucida sperm-binding protein 4-like isoform X1 [Gadus macrocephalus]|uniref:zona pellucida sperm-binding protein 4-like isoform X1 n=2 Tax=Gadus macrocephalus TaxID=80720 RepID=UPI0028CB4A5B|nr:zona pellucida sperm-binding protein 4-like isoform X1 [Gadus macrocephalus]
MVGHSSVPLSVALVLLGCYAGNLVVAQKGAQHPQPSWPAYPPPQDHQPPKTPSWPAHPPPQDHQPPKTPSWPAHPPPQDHQPPKTPSWPAHPPQHDYQPPKTPSWPAHPPPQHQQPPKAPEYPKQPPWPAHRPPMKHSQVEFDAAGKGQHLQNPGQVMSPNPQSCEVDIPLRVPCGGPEISPAACMEIHCCSDINGCYYGKAVTVQCTKDASFIVVAARDATLPNIDLESISLMSSEPDCTHVDFNSLFAIYHFPVTSCGSVVMEVQGSIIYENRLFSTYELGVGPLGSITRDSYYEVRFRCIYRGVSVETLMTQTMNLAGPVAIAPVIGPIQVELRLGNGVCTTKGCRAVDVAYDSYYVDSDYPVTKVLRDPVYIEVRLLNMMDPRLILTLGRCWTTTQLNPHSLPQWDILIEGCPNQGDRYLSTLIPIGLSSGLPFPSHYKRFIFQMFTFVDQDMSPLKEQVYIHCSTEVCTPGQGEQCDSRCGGRKKKRDVAATAVAKEPRMVMTVGPLLMGRVEEAHQVP